LVPALLPPHKKITNRRLAAVTALFFGCDTRRVSQCATGLPMKFVRKMGQDYQRAVIIPLTCLRSTTFNFFARMNVLTLVSPSL
jgi:hypothetical protein